MDEEVVSLGTSKVTVAVSDGLLAILDAAVVKLRESFIQVLNDPGAAEAADSVSVVLSAPDFPDAFRLEFSIVDKDDDNG